MHIILCLRAREKSKIVPKHESKSGKEEIISLGILPICEKNTIFEALLSLQLDEKTHFATPVKVPEPLAHLFPGTKLLTKADGEAIRKWNDTGAVADPTEQLAKRARAAAETGMASYEAFFRSLAANQRKLLAGQHAELKGLAEQVDRDAVPEADALPDAIEQSIGTRMRSKGVEYEVKDNGEMYVWEPVTSTS
jgi:hypothetical protein